MPRTSDFQLAFSRAPSHITGEKWTSRLVRQYATHDTYSLCAPSASPSRSAGASAGFGPGAEAGAGSSARSEKARFLNNLWRAQALYKAREGKSHVRCNMLQPARAQPGEEPVKRVVYWNVYERRRYLAEASKVSWCEAEALMRRWLTVYAAQSAVVLHVDPLRGADALPFGAEAMPPLAALRIHSIDEEYGECS
jgi:hypothetical protein